MKRLFVTLLLMCAAAFAQTDYKIRGYELNIVPDFSAKTIQVTTSIRIANTGHQNRFEFGLGDEQRVQSLTVNGAPADYTATDGTLTITLAKAADDLTIAVTTNSKPGKSHDEDAAVIDDNSLYLLWSDRYYPIDFDHWAPVRTTLTLPKDFKVAAPGHLVASQERDGLEEVTYESSQPTICYSVFADRRWLRKERMVNGFKVITLLHPEQDKYAERIFTGSGDVLKFFTELHGYYPAEQFSVVTVAGMRGRRALNGFIAYGPSFLDREMERTGYDAHETSLLWWGYATRGTGPGAFQWTEGLGDYVEFLYGEARKKPLPAVFDRFRNEYLATPVEHEPLYTELRGNTPQKFVHGKYPWLMAALHDSIGDAAFRKGLQSLFVEHRNSTFAIGDLIKHMESASGTSLDWWRRQWLERRGVPELSVQYETTSNVTSRGTTYSLRGVVEQHGNVYTIPLQLGVRTAVGIEYSPMTITGPQSVFQWSGTRQPLEVIVDPDKRLLLKVRSTPAAPDAHN